MAKSNMTNNEIKALTKVLDAGYTTEKDITGLTLDKILSIPNITVADINLINELQKAVKANKVITFLGGQSNGTEQ